MKDKFSDEFKEIEVNVNTLDVRGRGVDGVYLTVLGTSAEGGDSGQVGRGNGVNGVIPLMRPRSSEAAAGKNPISHVGKIYNLYTHEIAREIAEGVDGVDEVYVWLLSRIGQPIDQPALAAAEIHTGRDLGEIRPEVEEIIARKLESIGDFINKLIEGMVPVY